MAGGLGTDQLGAWGACFKREADCRSEVQWNENTLKLDVRVFGLPKSLVVLDAHV